MTVMDTHESRRFDLGRCPTCRAGVVSVNSQAVHEEWSGSYLTGARQIVGAECVFLSERGCTCGLQRARDAAIAVLSVSSMLLDLREQSDKIKEVRAEFHPGHVGAGEVILEVDGDELAVTGIELIGGMIQIRIEERWG